MYVCMFVCECLYRLFAILRASRIGELLELFHYLYENGGRITAAFREKIVRFKIHLNH